MNEQVSLTYHQAQAVAELSAQVRKIARRHKGYGYTEQARVVLEIGNPYYTEPNPELQGLYVRVEGGGAPVPLFAKSLGQPRTFDAGRLPARDENGHVQHPDMDGIGWDEFNMGPQLRALGWRSTMICFESDASHEAQERYDAGNSPDCSFWTPSRPQGDGWLLAAIYDTEDGPVALYVRSADGVESARELSDDEAAAVKFYADNPTAALFDLRRRISTPVAVQASAECLNVKGNPRDGYYCDECGSGPCTRGVLPSDSGGREYEVECNRCGYTRLLCLPDGAAPPPCRAPHPHSTEANPAECGGTSFDVKPADAGSGGALPGADRSKGAA